MHYDTLVLYDLAFTYLSALAFTYGVFSPIQL